VAVVALLIGAGCRSTASRAQPVEAPQNPTQATQGPVPEASPATAVLSVQDDACDPVLMGMSLGQIVYENDAYVVPEFATRVDLRGAVVDAASLGHRVVAAAGLGLSSSPSLRLVLLTPVDGKAQRNLDAHGVYPRLTRALAHCVEGVGYQLVGEPVLVGERIRVDMSDVAGLPLNPGSVSVMLETVRQDGDAREELVLIQQPESAASVPVVPTTAVLGVVDHWTTLPHGKHDELRRVEGSGWYPMDGRAAYLHVRHVGDRVDMAVLATVGGADIDRSPASAWALVGSGPMPEACDGASAFGCRAFKLPDADLDPTREWIAGVWTHASAATDARGIADPRARWFFVRGSTPVRRKGPDGNKPLSRAIVWPHPALP